MDAGLNWRPAAVAVEFAAAVDCVAAGDCASKYDAPFQLRMQRLLLRLLLRLDHNFDCWASIKDCQRSLNKAAYCTLPLKKKNMI